jgi:hypothetical protein
MAFPRQPCLTNQDFWPNKLLDGMKSPLQDLEGFGGGVFLTRRGIESRVTEATLWSAFKKPVVVWVHGGAFGDSEVDRLIEIARMFPHIRRFRFTSTRVTPEAVRRLYEVWPDIPVEGVEVQQTGCRQRRDRVSVGKRASLARRA